MSEVSSNHRRLNISRAHRNGPEWKLMLKLDPVSSLHLRTNSCLMVEKKQHQKKKQRPNNSLSHTNLHNSLILLILTC